MTPPRLVADISAHGFGHLAQTAAVLSALHKMRPDIELVVRTAHNAETVASFLPAPHTVAPPPPDIGMMMHGPSSVDINATLKAYDDLLHGADDVIAAEADALNQLAPTAVLANIPFLSPLIAAAARVPAALLCSLNWYDILAGYVEKDTHTDDILERIKSGYLAADRFLLPAPAMPTAWHPGRTEIGPIAREFIPAPLPAAFAEAFRDQILVLVSLGGIKSDFDLGALPQLDKVTWLTRPHDHPLDRPDIVEMTSTGLSFLELLPHVDAMITKSGYGSFVEAASVGARVLYAARPDWPEATSLEPWLLANATAAPITQDALYEGTFAADLAALLERPKSPPVATSGANNAAMILIESYFPPAAMERS